MNTSNYHHVPSSTKLIQSSSNKLSNDEEQNDESCFDYIDKKGDYKELSTNQNSINNSLQQTANPSSKSNVKPNKLNIIPNLISNITHYHHNHNHQNERQTKVTNSPAEIELVERKDLAKSNRDQRKRTSSNIEQALSDEREEANKKLANGKLKNAKSTSFKRVNGKHNHHPHTNNEKRNELTFKFSRSLSNTYSVGYNAYNDDYYNRDDQDEIKDDDENQEVDRDHYNDEDNEEEDDDLYVNESTKLTHGKVYTNQNKYKSNQSLTNNISRLNEDDELLDGYDEQFDRSYNRQTNEKPFNGNYNNVCTPTRNNNTNTNKKRMNNQQPVNNKNASDLSTNSSTTTTTSSSACSESFASSASNSYQFLKQATPVRASKVDAVNTPKVATLTPSVGTNAINKKDMKSEELNVVVIDDNGNKIKRADSIRMRHNSNVNISTNTNQVSGQTLKRIKNNKVQHYKAKKTLSPRRQKTYNLVVIVLLFLVNLLNYIDRYTLAGNNLI
jgi:hypothetical protein